MIDVISVQNMRKSDAHTIESGTLGQVLMYRAGEGMYRLLRESVERTVLRQGVAVVAGSGNNAGDGYVIAELLEKDGFPVTLYLLSDAFSPDGAYYFARCREKGIPFLYCTEACDFSAYGVVIDCLFGTGFRPPAVGLAASVIEAINRSGAFVLSADINSGIAGDNGRGTPAVVSDLTVSVGSYQPGHFLGRAKDLMKRKANLDIGISPVDPPYRLLEKEDIRAVLPHRLHDSNKSTYGYMALIGGSECYSGAIRLAAMANSAMRAGAGVVLVAAPRSLMATVTPSILESTYYPLTDKNGALCFVEAEFETLCRRVKTIAFGMGIGNTAETQKALAYLLMHFTGTLIVDADGLNALAAMGSNHLDASTCRVILTPHAMEFARLLGHTSTAAVESDPIPLATQFAKAHRVILLLKGATTTITDGSTVYLTDRGCAGMATAGSGDVLSGILAAMCGYNRENLLLATAGAAYLNGYAGEIAEAKSNAIAMIASDTVAAICEAVVSLSQ